jgi:hypothetical protein
MEEITDNARARSKFLLVYFYLLVVSTGIIMAQPGSLTTSTKDVFQTFFTILGFVAFFGYVHGIRIFNRFVWIVLLPLYFLWEIGCYLFIKNPWFVNLLILVALLPKYWSVALYPLITMEKNQEARLSNTRRRDYCVSRFKILFVGTAVLATLAQVVILGMFFVSVFLR